MPNADEMQVIEHGDSIMKVARENDTWLGVVDIFDSAPLKVTVEKVVRVKNATFEKGRKEDVQALVFKGAKKMLVLNKTNTRLLWKKYGHTPAELAGKTVTLVVEQLPREFNGHTHGIRIR